MLVQIGRMAVAACQAGSEISPFKVIGIIPNGAKSKALDMSTDMLYYAPWFLYYFSCIIFTDILLVSSNTMKPAVTGKKSIF